MYSFPMVAGTVCYRCLRDLWLRQELTCVANRAENNWATVHGTVYVYERTSSRFEISRKLVERTGLA